MRFHLLGNGCGSVVELLTQDELAHQVGCAPITIRKIEGDEMRPSKLLAESLSGPLGIPAKQRDDFVRFARAEAKEILSNHFASFFQTAESSATSEPDLPTGTVHLLFSDIGGSTQLAQHLGENYRNSTGSFESKIKRLP